MECNLIGWAQAGNHERGVATMVFRRQERRITFLVATLASMLVIPSAFVASAAEPASSAKIDQAAASDATQSVLDPAPQPQRRAPRSARGKSQQRAHTLNDIGEPLMCAPLMVMCTRWMPAMVVSCRMSYVVCPPRTT